MEITLTISVTESENVSVRTQARNISQAQIRPALIRAHHALQAEIDALDNCPWHQAQHLDTATPRADIATVSN